VQRITLGLAIGVLGITLAGHATIIPADGGNLSATNETAAFDVPGVSSDMQFELAALPAGSWGAILAKVMTETSQSSKGDDDKEGASGQAGGSAGVPEPVTMILVGGGLVAVSLLSRKKMRN
jgi:hypothetical protein